MSDNIIFIISNEPWGRQWFSKHHYASELSANHDVFYINPVDKWSIGNLLKWKIRKTKINENLTVVNYSNPLPLLCQSQAIMYVNDCLNILKFKSLANPSKQIIFWQFDPYRFVHIFLKKYRRIYHVVDPYQSVKWDRIIATKADLVVSVRKDFLIYYRELNKNTLYIPHGIGASQKSFHAGFAGRIRSKYNSFILYIGTVSNHIDTDLLLKIIRHFPGINLLMVGPYAKNLDLSRKKQLDHLQKADNFFHIPLINHRKINDYIHASDVCIIPYSSNEENKRTPLKLMNYIAQYKPVVSSYPLGIKELENHIVFTARDADDFITILSKGLKGKLRIDKKKVNAYLDAHTYKKLIHTVLSKVFLK